MAENSKIEWTTHTFNPWRGCSKISAGCANCYAETLSGRNPGTLGVWGPNGTRVVASEAMWREPLKWNRDAEKIGDWFCPSCDAYLSNSRVTFEENCDTCGTAVEFHKARPRVFCASLGDVFEDWTGPMVMSDGDDLWTCESCRTIATRPLLVSGYSKAKSVDDCPDCAGVRRPTTMQDVRARLFALIDATPNLDWLVLTKRPENIAQMMPARPYQDCDHPRQLCVDVGCVERIRPNLWLGVSCENQQAADERIPHLLRVPAAVRFLSCEPLLGPVDLDLRRYESDTGWFDERGRVLDWVIVGGESGPGARPMHPDWARSLRDQCQAAGTPFFFKQFGEYEPWADVGGDVVLDRDHKFPDGEIVLRVGKKAAGRLLDGRTWDEFPAVGR